MSPRVSVVIPCYNTSDLIAETLDSVLAQTYRNFEVILVNDGSPDTERLERVLQPYLDRIIYIRQENRGVSAARNRGIRAARGELIATIDSDDLWVPECLAFQVEQLDADPSADIVYPNASYFGVGETGERVAMTPGSHMPEATFTSVVNEQCAVVTSLLAKKKALERAGLYDESLARSEDFDLWLRCLKTGSRIVYHHKVLIRSRRRPGSLSSDAASMSEHAAKVLRKMQATMPLTAAEKVACERKLRHFDGNQLFYEGKHAFFAGDYATAVSKLQAANRFLRSARIALVLLVLRAAPGLAKTAYSWRHRTSPNN